MFLVGLSCDNFYWICLYNFGLFFYLKNENLLESSVHVSMYLKTLPEIVFIKKLRRTCFAVETLQY
jgi:hypothetical protein